MMRITKMTVLALGLILSVFGCKEIDKLTQFNMEFTETMVISAETDLNTPTDIFSPEVETYSETVFELNDTRKELVEQIKLEELSLSISTPEENDFSFLNSVEIFLYTEDLPETKVAWKDNIASDLGDMIVMEVSDIDIKDYMKSDLIGLRVSTITDEEMEVDHEIKVKSKFFIDAKVLGQ